MFLIAILQIQILEWICDTHYNTIYIMYCCVYTKSTVLYHVGWVIWKYWQDSTWLNCKNGFSHCMHLSRAEDFLRKNKKSDLMQLVVEEKQRRDGARVPKCVVPVAAV